MQTITPAQKIKMLREQKDLTQEKLADALRVSVGTIKNWENGTSEPSMSAVEDLAKLFKVSVVDIFGTTATSNDNDAIERINNESEINEMIQSNAAESLKLAKSWIEEHPEKAFKPGFNMFGVYYRYDDEHDIRKIYGEKFYERSYHSIANIGVIAKRLKAKGYMLTMGGINLDYSARCEVFLRDENEAKAFTQDLAIALAMPVEFGNTIEESTYEDFDEVIHDADRKISALLTRMIYDAKRIKYTIAIINQENIIEHVVQAVDGRDLINKIQTINPERYTINTLNEEASRKLYEKLLSKTAK